MIYIVKDYQWLILGHGNNDNNNHDNNNNNDAHHHKDIPLSIYASNLPKQLEGLKNQEKY